MKPFTRNVYLPANNLKLRGKKAFCRTPKSSNERKGTKALARRWSLSYNED